MHDADARRRSEAAARQYEKHDRSFVALAQTAISPVITTTPEGIITTWNPAAERLYGFVAAETIGMPIDIIIPSDERQRYRDVVATLLGDRLGDGFMTVRVAKDGRRVDILLILSAIKSLDGETIGIINVTRDITALKAAEDKFRLAVESCPNGMMMSDAAGTIVMINKEIERLFGYERD